MDPFKVSCVTCRARLTVNNPALIGQILACPRCGSMVQIAPPAGAALTEPQVAAPTSAPTIQSLADPEIQSAAAFAAAEANFAAQLQAELQAPGAATNAANEAGAAPVAAATNAGRAWGPYKLAATLLVSGLAGAAAVGVGLSWRQDDDSTAAPAASVSGASKSDAAAPRTESALPAPSIDVAPADFNEAGSAASADVETIASPSAEIAVRKAEKIQLPTVEDPATTGSTDDVASPPPIPLPSAPVDPNAGVNGQVAAATNPPAPRLHIDPLQIDPEGIDLASLLNAPANDPLTAGNLAAADESSSASAAPGEEQPSDADSMTPGAQSRGPIVHSGPPVNLDELLRRRFPSVQADRMPLGRFIDFAGELAAVPVSVTPDELRLAAVSAASAVSVKATSATIEEILSDALAPLRLTPHVEGAQIVLRRAADGRRQLEYPLDGLVDSDAQADQWASWVQDLVAPETWQSHGGAGRLEASRQSLHIEQTERVAFQVVMLLERFRLARGLAPRSKYPVEQLLVGPAGAELAQRLAGTTTFTFSQPTPLREVVRYWQEELGVSLLVDWPALAQQRLWPDTRISTAAANRPWSAALAETLEPLELGWRPIDARTIEISSLESIRTQPELAIYRLSERVDAAAGKLLAEVDRLAGKFADPSAVSGAAKYDAEHRVLLVRQPASVQRELVAWLDANGYLAAP